MQKKWGIALFLLIAVFTGTMLAYAGIHFGGATSFGYGSLKADVQVLEVLRSSSVLVNIHAVGRDLTAWCVNPAGAGQYGRNPIHLNVSVADSKTVTADETGTAYASFELNLLPSSARRAGCPNNQWTVTDLFGTVHVTLTASSTDAQGKRISTSEDLDCTVNQHDQQVTCQLVSTS
jgi:hypothetical protein